MNNQNIYILKENEIPFPLTQIPEPPEKLFICGNLPKENTKILCIVGARKYSNYGEEVTKKLIAGLTVYNICIVSGLALGIDAIVHRSALDAKLQTIAFPGSGLDPKVLYPQKHKKLVDEIVYSGGAIISEFEMLQTALPWTFPKRNRLMAGISQATIVIEALLPSGSLITSKLALDYNRDIGAVPGNIDSKLSAGSNMLIRSGAVPITCSEDILEMLGFNRPEGEIVQREMFLNLNEKEKIIIEFLQIEPNTNEMLILKSNFNAKEINEILSSLEIQGLIKEVNGKFKLC